MLPEVTEYLASIERVRGKIFKTLEEMPPEAWNWAPTSDETNSMYVVVTHCLGSEHGWLYEILGRGEQTRNRPAEFLARGETLDTLRQEFARVDKETRQVLEGLTEADLTTTRYRESHGEVTSRWVILHVIEHSSEHLGQLYLTKQLWEQKSGS